MQQVKILRSESDLDLQAKINQLCKDCNSVFATQLLVRHNEILAFCWFKTE